MKPSICFVALKSYAVLSGDPSVRHIGGAEVQQSLLARELVRRGYPVRFVVLDHGQADGIEIDGIRVFKAYSPDAGIPGLRFFYPKLARLWSAMARADAVVYYQRGAEAETGLVALWCRRAGRKFVFGAASDTNFLPDLPLVPSPVDRRLFRYGLRRADAIIVQTERQRRMLWDWQALTAEVVNNACATPKPSDAPPPSRKGVLWIGRYHECKRADWVARLAHDVPAMTFTVIGASNARTEYERRVSEELARLPNVVVLGYVPYACMGGHYRSARALLCTSSDEGFPNTFLEAWAYGVPVLTTFDPDGVVAAQRLGRTANGLEELRSGLASLMQEPQFWEACGVRAQQYVTEHNAVDSIAEALGRVLDRVCDSRSPLGRVVRTNERG